MLDLDFKYEKLTNEILKDIPFTPEIALILGSGLGDFAKNVEIVKSIPTSSLDRYPVSTVQGHEGYIHFATHAGKKILIFQGRIHFYEGYKLSECIVPVHISDKLDCKKIILTNAAGGINSHFNPGDLMLITSFLAINLKKELTELIGLSSVDIKNSFLNLPSKRMNEIIQSAALEEKILLKEGSYWFSKGPSYETSSEIKMLSKMGIDSVGMSTVHEAIYASIRNIEVGAISLITNYAAGISKEKLSHNEVIETAELAKAKFEKLIKKIIELS